MSKERKELILLELNEINFDLVAKYIELMPNCFPALNRLLKGERIRTVSELNYSELEPWIQWPSVHTGKTFAEHKIFRLGDMVGASVPQIFELVESAGFKVGSISAMNAENRLKSPAYFIPDPWTQTPSDKSWWSRSLTQAVSQAVNDNAKSKITFKSALIVAIGLVRFARVKNYLTYLKLISGVFGRSWNRALVLDLFLHDIHLTMFESRRPGFSTLFLNAGAHIQHHYFYNSQAIKKEIKQVNPAWYISSDADPLADVLSLYDSIVDDYMGRADVEVILATGLAQKPYDYVKFYYRLNAHADFLSNLGLKFVGVFPRMTRDFLVEFSDEAEALKAQEVLSDIHVDGDNAALFGEIDNRGRSLFVTLTYPKEVTDSTSYVFQGSVNPLKPHVSFVAIKNGMHQAEGFAFFSDGLKCIAPEDGAHVASLGKMIAKYFGVTV